MRYLKYILPLLLVMVLPSYAQKLPVRFIRPDFPIRTTFVNMTALRESLLTSAREAGITSHAQLLQEITKANTVKSVFRAYPRYADDFAYPMSGFIFKTTYQGKEEIFGVIAQHATPILPRRGALIGSPFTARVIQNYQVVDIPAEIVQMSAPSMPDMALIKFQPKDEKLLTPLTLAEQDPARNELLHMVGFGSKQLLFITDSPLLEKSLLNLRFPMAGDSWGEWPGLCGSPVLNEQGEVVGTMTGVGHKDPSYYTGYATRNLYLRSLVAAYHGDVEKASFPLMLGGEKIVDLRPDEFIARIILTNENNETIFDKVVEDKFPYSTVVKHLATARYLELYISRVWWTGSALKEGTAEEGRYVKYDLKEKKIIWSDR